MLYKFIETRVPSPGAYNYAFLMQKELPLLRCVGAGVPAYSRIRPLQPPQFQQQLRIALAGYGGIVAGTIGGTPLTLDPLGLKPADAILG